MRKAVSSSKLTLVIGLAAVVGVAVVSRLEPGHDGPEARVAPSLVDVPLASDAGATKLGDLKGRWIVALFGYMTCPDVCPTTLAYLAREAAALGPVKDQVRFVFLSADPARDTPDALGKYVRHFDPEFLGLTGTEANLGTVAESLGAYFAREDAGESAAGYLVTHSSSLFVIDPVGRFVKALPAPHKAGAVAAELKRLAGAPAL